ncbi:hypothetical protein FRB94_009179 [Tulasnella sp. JGI-2019a]|nr:hypothetical protein FRB94_009179 [Tulasnella sp. JGI-2019a]KAG9008221.1 hypothetical protein FRB93_006789 [Tulasnella sp. JGI-2019a]
MALSLFAVLKVISCRPSNIEDKRDTDYKWPLQEPLPELLPITAKLPFLFPPRTWRRPGPIRSGFRVIGYLAVMRCDPSSGDRFPDILTNRNPRKMIHSTPSLSFG